MRWRWSAFIVVFVLILLQLSCRKSVAPNTDQNRAPETYLTAVPLDSIGGGRLNAATYRYHVHWSGSDIDGEVSGFFVAVTETLPGLRLPAPKPQQFVFTTRRDSVIVFDVHEGRGVDREHGIYIFAVDNEGKSDPTPAFSRFVARDQNLPGIIWETARAEGQIFVAAVGGGVMPQPFSRALTDNQDPVGARFAPIDTIPVGSAIFFGWRGYDSDWNSRIAGYRYKLVEPEFIRVDSTVRRVEYATGVGSATTPLLLGLNVFRVRAVDEASGTTFPDSLRRFVVNFDPDTWWAGPDPSDPTIAAALQSDERGVYLRGVGQTGSPPAELDPWLGDARFCVLPADRRPVHTFIEQVRRGADDFRYYLRADSDTVARNASAIYLSGGGRDKDSPYRVLITPGDPPIDKCVVGTPDVANGSPIGLEYRAIRRTVRGARITGQYTQTFPNFNQLSASYAPEVYITDEVSHTGDQFVTLRSVDGSNGRDRRIRDPLTFVEQYNAGTLPPAQRVLRPLILTWNTNYNPYFMPEIQSAAGGFAPDPDTLITDPLFEATLFMHDPDSTATGGDRAGFQLRWRFLEDDDGDGQPDPRPADEGWNPEILPLILPSGDKFLISIPVDLTAGRNWFEFELADLPNPSSLEDRRTVFYIVPFYWQTRP
jgi:hypothetical protein